MHSDFASDIEEYAAAGCKSVEIWLTKLETYLQQKAVDDARSLLDAHGVTCPVASYQGGLFQADGPALDECFEHFVCRLDLCSRLQIPTIVVAADVSGPLDQRMLDQLPDRAHWIADRAEDHGLSIAIEFQPDSAFLNNLKSLVLFLQSLERASLGICLDLACFEQSCSKESDLALLENSNLLHVQVCDFDGDFREFLTNGDRILPGDGWLDFGPFFSRFAAAGYAGTLAVEVHNPLIWAIPPRQFAEVALGSLNRIASAPHRAD